MSTVSNRAYKYGLAQRPERHFPQPEPPSDVEAIQKQAFILEACGGLTGKRVLDVGFGNGELARTLELMGAKVSAFDNSAERIPALRETAPGVAWWHANLATWTLAPNAEQFDIAIASDVLNQVEFDDAIRRLLPALSRPGRLIALAPNLDCSSARRSAARNGRRIAGISMRDVPARLYALFAECLTRKSETWRVALRGLHLQQDQTIGPLIADSWHYLDFDEATSAPTDVAAEYRKAGIPVATPNRIQIVISTSEQS